MNPKSLISLKDFVAHTTTQNNEILSSKITFFFSFSGYSAGQLDVRIGSQSYTTGGSVEELEEVYVHDDFDYGTIDYDYSLLKLKNSLNFTDAIKSIALPEVDEDDIPDDTICIVSGWGNTMNSSESRLKLRAAKVPVVNQESCIKKYQSIGGVTPRMICAGYEEGGKDCKSMN